MLGTRYLSATEIVSILRTGSDLTVSSAINWLIAKGKDDWEPTNM